MLELLFALLTLLPLADQGGQSVHPSFTSEPTNGVMTQIDDDLGAGEEALERAVETAQEISSNPLTDWLVKFLVLSEGAVIFWLYKLIKSEEHQREILESVTAFWSRENVEESTHRRFAMLLNAIGQEVLYVAQGDFKSVLKLARDNRLMLFFRQGEGEEDLFFVEQIDEKNVYVQNSEKEKLTLPLEDFFKKKKFSFIVFLAEHSFGLNFTEISTEESE